MSKRTMTYEQMEAEMRYWHELAGERKETVEDVLEALKTCVRVFESQAERGRYPEELLPESGYYIGVQGFWFARAAINKAEGE